MADNNIAINRAPYFDGTNYLYWKMRMSTYIKANDYASWQVISFGDTQVVMNDDGSFTDEQLKHIEKNNKAKNLLLTTIAPSEFYLISSCETAKDIWDTLSKTYEGTNTIKETKINSLLQQYELFKIKPEEKIREAFNRFTAITNELTSLGKKMDDSDLVRKILRILPKSWDAKKTAIEEAQDLNKLTLSQLREKLLAYESHINTTEEAEGSSRAIAFKARKVTNDETDSDDDMEENIGMLARKLSKFFKGKKYNNFNKTNKSSAGKNYKEKEEKKEKKELVCYECKQPGHIKYECPILKKKMKKFKKKSRAMMATWSDLDESEGESEDTSDNEEEANLCLMAASEVHSDSDEDINENDIYSEMKKLLKALKKADVKITKLEVENKALKNEKDVLRQTNKLLIDENDILKNDNEKLFVKTDGVKKENEVLKTEIKELKGRVEDLSQSIKNTFNKFNESDKKLNMLIGSQRPSFIKHGLGYESENSSNSMKKTTFVKENKPVNNQASVHNVKGTNSESRRNIRRYVQPSYTSRRNIRRYRYVYNDYPTHYNYKKGNQRYYQQPYACSFCNKIGHIEKYCFYKRNKLSSYQVKKQDKTSLTYQGPKFVWVPKKV